MEEESLLSDQLFKLDDDDDIQMASSEKALNDTGPVTSAKTLTAKGESHPEIDVDS